MASDSILTTMRKKKNLVLRASVAAGVVAEVDTSEVVEAAAHCLERLRLAAVQRLVEHQPVAVVAVVLVVVAVDL